MVWQKTQNYLFMRKLKCPYCSKDILAGVHAVGKSGGIFKYYRCNRCKMTGFVPERKFDESIYLMETNEVLKSTDPMYSVIRVLQDLRNRLHLDKAKQLMDSDYNSFGEGTYKITKLILYNILNNEIVSKDNKYIDFLKPPEKIIITH